MKLNVVPARTGLLWVKLGMRTFFRQPLALAGLFFMYFMVVSLLAIVPVVGAPAAMMLAPAATLGIMAAAREAADGRFPMPTLLVSAFRAGPQRARAMLVLGALYAVALLAIVGLATLLSGGTPPVVPAEAPGAEAAAMPQMELSAGLVLLAVLQLPLLVVFAHAPALVHWHGLSPVKSLFFSLVAFFRNLGAYLVFALAWLLILFAATLGFGLLLRLLGAGPSVGTFMPLVLMVASMGTCSLFFSYRDSYRDDAPGGDPAAPPVSEGDTP